jgi:predicted membrane-bound dolichyl-phosphate-mannose-protein mannosyltransferase
MGVISLASGIIVLVFRVSGKDVHTLANQTVRLAQKGIADEVSGLVGNASALLDALNQLVRTTTGVGVFLIVVGFLLFTCAYYLAQTIR